LAAHWPQGNKRAGHSWFRVLDKMIAQDFLKTLFSVWAVIVIIIVSRKFIKILDKAIEGQISNDTLLSILGLKTITASISLLPAATFMALLMVLGRLYKDQEMSAIAAAGGGAGTLYRSVFITIFPLSLVTLGLSLYLSPWAEAKIQKTMNLDAQSSDIRSIAAGKFSEFSRGDLVFYVESVSADKTMNSVFVQDRRNNGLNIINAEHSHYQELPGGLYMVFQNGENIQGKPGTFNYTIEKFDEYAVRIEERAVSSYLSPDAIATDKLIQSKAPKDIAELEDRLDKPMGILLLSFLAVPLSRISPRGGVYGSMLLGFLTYFSYGNFSGVIRSWIIKGTVASWPGIFWVHLLLALVGLVLLTNWYGHRWLLAKIKTFLPK
jgi:lipopolysaccharide export system permease protein